MLPNLETKGQLRLTAQTWLAPTQESRDAVEPSQGVRGHSEGDVFGEVGWCKGSQECFNGAQKEALGNGSIIFIKSKGKEEKGGRRVSKSQGKIHEVHEGKTDISLYGASSDYRPHRWRKAQEKEWIKIIRRIGN